MKLYYYDTEYNEEHYMQIKNSDMDYWMSVIEDYNDYSDLARSVRPLVFLRKEEIEIGRDKKHGK